MKKAAITLILVLSTGSISFGCSPNMANNVAVSSKERAIARTPVSAGAKGNGKGCGYYDPTANQSEPYFGYKWPVEFDAASEFPMQVTPEACEWEGLSNGAKLCSAIAAGDLPGVRALLYLDPTLPQYVFTTSRFGGMQPLSIAILANQTEIAQFLIDQGADVGFHRQIKRGYGNNARGNGAHFCAATPMHYAAASGNVELIRALLAKGAEINPRWERPADQTSYHDYLHACMYASPLHVAAYFQADYKVVDTLLASGADARSKIYFDSSADGFMKHEYNATPVDIAASKGRSEPVRLAILKSLISAGSPITPGKALQGATLLGDLESVKLIVSSVPGVMNAPSRNGYGALHYAAALARSDIATFLVGAGADVSAWADQVHKTAPLEAALDGYADFFRSRDCDADANLSDIVDLLAHAGANMSGCGGPAYLGCANPLSKAASQGLPLVTAALIRSGVDLARLGVEALKMALTIDCQLDYQHKLGDCKVSPDVATGGDHRRGRIEAARTLIAAGVATNMAVSITLSGHKTEWMPLHLASLRDNVDLVAALINAKADLNAVTVDSGRTALHIAVINKASRVVEALLASGADVTTRDKYGRTPFDYL